MSVLSVSRFRLVSLAIAVIAFSAVPLFAESQARIVRLSDVQGAVQIDKNTGLGFENAFLNLPIIQGSQLRTRDNGRAEIEFEDGSTLRIGPNTQVDFSQLGNDSGKHVSTIDLSQGMAYLNWLGKSGDQLNLNFSREKVSLSQPAHFRVIAGSDQSKLAVFKGDVHVESPSGDVAVAKKKTAVFNADDDNSTIANKIEEGPLDSWDKESTSYHDQYAKNNASPFGYGYSDLNYYGGYSNVPGYGMMWQPYFVGAGWNPFMDGAWSFYPGYGYMFVSAYPWGWMPYRYGNWMFVQGSGWMWQPGGWNSWNTIPRYTAPPSVHVASLVAPSSGTVRTIAVGKGPSVPTASLPSRLVVNAGSAGLGIPRGSIENLHGLNHQVAKSGAVELHSTPAFATTSSPAVFTSAHGNTASSSMGSSASPSMGHISTSSSGHAAGGSSHH